MKTKIIKEAFMADQNNRQEASKIFLSITKASVSKPATEKKEKPKTKPKSKK